MAGSIPPASFSKRERLRKRTEFLAVQGRGRRLQSEHFMLFVATEARPEQRTRIGFTVSKKVGCAVVRNRVKRLAREVYRRHKVWFPDERDLVFVAKQKAAGVTYHALEQEMERLCARYFSR